MNHIIASNNDPKPADRPADGGQINFDEALRRVREDAARRQAAKQR